MDKITNVNLEEFLNDHLERSEIVLLEEGKENSDILARAEAKGYILKDSNDLAGFKTIYTFDTAANINKARLPKELLLKALPGIIGKPVDIDHNRVYVVGHYIDYSYVASKHMVIAYGVFYKSNFGEEWEKAKQLFKAGKLGTSYEIWCSKSKRKYLPDGTYVLTSIEIAGGGLMFKEKPAFPDAKVLELAKKNMDTQSNELIFACDQKKVYDNDDIVVSGRNVYDALVKPVNRTTIPVSDQMYTADELIGKPVGSPKSTPAGMLVKPIVGIPNPQHTQVGIDVPTGKPSQSPGNLVDLQQKNALQNTGLQPNRIKNDNLGDNLTQQGPQVTACACSNCKHSFVPSAQTFCPKNHIDFGPCTADDAMHKCPSCKSIIDRQGYMLHPPQVVDFSMRCPSCSSSNWRLLTNEPEKADVKCMQCSKNYHLEFQKPEVDPLRAKLQFMRSGYSACPQCSNNVPYSTVSNADTKEITCPKCNLHYAINLNRGGEQRKIFKANEFVQQEDYCNISPTGGDGKELSAVEKASAKKQKFVPRSNQQITDQMASQNITDKMGAKQKEKAPQNQKVDNILTKNLHTDKHLDQNPNEPMNAGAIYLVRHGKTALNSNDAEKDNDRIRGWRNIPLDKQGRQQAKDLGQIFKGQKMDKIYSSDLSRARDTADQISKGCGTPVNSKFDLRPWDLGVHTGMHSVKVQPEIMKSAMETPHIKVKGGESFNNFKTRALNFARKLIDEAKQGKKVVAVTHTRVAKLVQAWIAAGCPDDNSLNQDEFMKDTIKTGSIHKIQPTDKGVKVTEVQDLQKASILDTDTTVSSKKGENTMEQENKEVPATVEETQAVAKATPAEVTVVDESPIGEQDAPIEVEDGADEALEQEEVLEVSKTLTTEERHAIPTGKFAVVKTVKNKKTGGTRTIRKYPIHDKAHVQNALARLHQDASRKGLEKLGVDPDAVINKVKAAGKKMGMEVAEMEGYCVSSKGHDMQTVVKRGKDNVQEKTPKDPNNYVGASAEKIEEAKKVKTGDNGVAGLTPDQVNQMQNQLFANVKKAMTFRKYHKAAMKNVKALKKAMAEGCYASVQEVDVIMNMDIVAPSKTTTVSDVGTGEKPTEAVVTGKAPDMPTQSEVIDNNDGAQPKELADALKPASIGEAVDVIKAPASPVANSEVPSAGKETTVSNPDGAKVSGGTKDANGCATAVPSLDPTHQTSNSENSNFTSPGKETTVSTISDEHVSGGDKGSASDNSVKTSKVSGDGSDTEIMKSSIEAAQKENEALKEKIKILETAANKLISRRNSLGDFGNNLSDKDIMDDDKFEVAQVKAENARLKKELNTASSHLAETIAVRGEDEVKTLAQQIKEKAKKLY